MPLAQFQGDDILGLLLGALFLMIPIVAILTTHQQKMAKIMRESQGAANNSDNEALRRELEALRQMVLQQTIAIDSLAQQQRDLAAQAAPQPLQERLR